MHTRHNDTISILRGHMKENILGKKKHIMFNDDGGQLGCDGWSWRQRTQHFPSQDIR